MMRKAELLQKVSKFASLERLTFKVANAARGRSARARRPIVYVAGAPDPSEFGIEPGGYSIRGDGSEDDKQWKKYNRAEMVITRFFLDRAQEKIREEILNVSSTLHLPYDLQFSFSRKAGCSCGCSPGWIIKNSEAVYGGISVSMNITSPKKEREEAAHRRKIQMNQFDPVI